MRIAVLASGGGSNLGALLTHFARPEAAASGAITCVGSDKADSGALERARAHGVHSVHIGDPRDGVAMRGRLRDLGVDLIVLAGYLRLVPTEVVMAWPGRVLNIHPALLPAFGGAGMYGLRVHSAVIASGVLVSGATVHFVDEHFDRGAIAAQWPVPVYAHDTAKELAARVLKVEHRLLPLVVEAVASGTLSLGTDGRVHGHIGMLSEAQQQASTRFSISREGGAQSQLHAADPAEVSLPDDAAFARDIALLYPR